MSTHNICFCGEIRKTSNSFGLTKASFQELWTSLFAYDIMLFSPVTAYTDNPLYTDT